MKPRIYKKDGKWHYINVGCHLRASSFELLRILIKYEDILSYNPKGLQ